MTTLILTKYKFLDTDTEGGRRYLATKLFYGGDEFDLPVFFKDKESEELFAELPVIALKGYFKEQLKPLRIRFYDAQQVALPEGDNWLAFFINYFLEKGVETCSIEDYENGYCISTNLEHYSVWARISKDKLTIEKIEFNRYLPLESGYIRRLTSWIKGVFVNDKSSFIKFLQSSWDGEEGPVYTAEFNSENLQLVTDFLSVPFHIGWTEYDYRIGKEGFYKAGAKTVFNGRVFENTFTLLDIGEQDIPYPTDKLEQWFRTRWADSAINNFRRHIDITEVAPIVPKLV